MDDLSDTATKLSTVAPPQARPQVSLLSLAIPFAKIGLTSFGGGLSAWVYREIVALRGWLSEDEFVGALTISQILPGPNIINLSMNIGYLMRGSVGGLVAILALLIPPILIALLMSAGLALVNEYVWLHQFMEGLAAAAMGLSASVGIRNVKNSFKFGVWPVALSGCVIIGVFFLQWPIVPVIFALAALGLLIARAKYRSGLKDQKPTAKKQ